MKQVLVIRAEVKGNVMNNFRQNCSLFVIAAQMTNLGQEPFVYTSFFLNFWNIKNSAIGIYLKFSRIYLYKVLPVKAKEALWEFSWTYYNI